MQGSNAQAPQEFDFEPLFKLAPGRTKKVLIDTAKQFYEDGKLPTEVLSNMLFARSPRACLTILLNHLIHLTRSQES